MGLGAPLPNHISTCRSEFIAPAKHPPTLIEKGVLRLKANVIGNLKTIFGQDEMLQLPSSAPTTTST